MNTATVLLENIIQGIQTGVWIILLLFSFLDYTAFMQMATPDKIPVGGALILASSYWLGITVDTVYYHLFIQFFEKQWAAKRLKDTNITLLTLVCRCLVESPELGKLLLERQAHLRMIRVSMINIILIAASAIVFITVRHIGNFAAILLITGIGTFLALSTAFAWRKLYGYYITLAQSGYEAILKKRANA
jgi:hypothetical protein